MRTLIHELPRLVQERIWAEVWKWIAAAHGDDAAVWRHLQPIKMYCGLDVDAPEAEIEEEPLGHA